ncbi:MAG: hypothetical protein AB1749_10150, partial [Pseudomonadota bacterium]
MVPFRPAPIPVETIGGGTRSTRIGATAPDLAELHRQQQQQARASSVMRSKLTLASAILPALAKLAAVALV